MNAKTKRKKSKPDAAKKMVYLLGVLPKEIPAGWCLYHNPVYPPSRRVGVRGSRSFLMKKKDIPSTLLKPCDCGFAPELGTHYSAMWRRPSR